MADTTHTSLLTKKLRLHMAALMYFLAGITTALLLTAMPAWYVLRVLSAGNHSAIEWSREWPFIVGCVCLGAILWGFYHILASPLRCTVCGSPVFMSSGQKKHPYARRLLFFGQRERVAFDILFKRNYHCMYCHTRCMCKTQAVPAVSGKSRRNPSIPPAFVPASAPPTDGGSPFSSIFGGTQAVESPPAVAASAPLAPPPSLEPAMRSVGPAIRHEDAPAVKPQLLFNRKPTPVTAPVLSAPVMPFPTTPNEPQMPFSAFDPSLDTATSATQQAAEAARAITNPFLLAAATHGGPPPPQLIPDHMRPSMDSGREAMSMDPHNTSRAITTPPFAQDFPFLAPGTQDPVKDAPPWTLPAAPVRSAPAVAVLENSPFLAPAAAATPVSPLRPSQPFEARQFAPTPAPPVQPMAPAAPILPPITAPAPRTAVQTAAVPPAEVQQAILNAMQQPVKSAPIRLPHIVTEGVRPPLPAAFTAPVPLPFAVNPALPAVPAAPAAEVAIAAPITAPQPAAAPAVSAATSTAPLVREIVNVLATSQQQISDAFSGLIEKLQAALVAEATPAPSAPPVLAPIPTAPVSLAPIGIPQTTSPVLPPLMSVSAPVAHPITAPVSASYTMPEHITEPVYEMPMAPPVQPTADAAAPRRRFARPAAAPAAPAPAIASPFSLADTLDEAPPAWPRAESLR